MIHSVVRKLILKDEIQRNTEFLLVPNKRLPIDTSIEQTFQRVRTTGQRNIFSLPTTAEITSRPVVCASEIAISWEISAASKKEHGKSLVGVLDGTRLELISISPGFYLAAVSGVSSRCISPAPSQRDAALHFTSTNSGNDNGYRAGNVFDVPCQRMLQWRGARPLRGARR